MKKKYINPSVMICKMDAEASLLSASMRINNEAGIFEGQVNEDKGFWDAWE